MKKMNNHRQRKEMKEDTLKKVSNDAKRKVLVVEDNQLNREMLAEILFQMLGLCIVLLCLKWHQNLLKNMEKMCMKPQLPACFTTLLKNRNRLFC